MIVYFIHLYKSIVADKESKEREEANAASHRYAVSTHDSEERVCGAPSKTEERSSEQKHSKCSLLFSQYSRDGDGEP
jgi:hypothetical protein